MAEVEQGVAGIINGLEQKLEDSEKRARDTEKESEERSRDMEKQLIHLRDERDEAMARADKAERALESGKDLGGALREANDRVGQVMADLRNANTQMKDLEDEVMRSDARIDELEKELKEDKDAIESLEDELNVKSDDLAAERSRIRALEARVQETEEELGSAKAYADELEEGATAAVEQIDNLELEISSLREQSRGMAAAIDEANEKMSKLQEEADQAQELTRQMEEALGDAESKMLSDEEAIAELRSKVASLDRELERQRHAATVSRDTTRDPEGPTDEELEVLERELDNAHQEIGRLTSLLSQSPARKAIEKAKDMKIEMLEKEKEDLMERNKALRVTATDINSSSKFMNNSGISPIHRHVLAMSIKAPRTPGAPLRDVTMFSLSVLCTD